MSPTQSEAVELLEEAGKSYFVGKHDEGARIVKIDVSETIRPINENLICCIFYAWYKIITAICFNGQQDIESDSCFIAPTTLSVCGSPFLHP